MAVVEELIRKEADGTLSFGNYTLDTKTKKSDFEYEGEVQGINKTPYRFLQFHQKI